MNLEELDENIEKLRDSPMVGSAQTLRHETRLKEHQKWQEDMELAFARMAARDEIHSAKTVEFDQKTTQVAAAQLLAEKRFADCGTSWMVSSTPCVAFAAIGLRVGERQSWQSCRGVSKPVTPIYADEVPAAPRR